MQSSTVSQAIPLEHRANTLDEFSTSQVDFDIMTDGESFADGQSQVTRSSRNSCTSLASHQAEGVTLIEPTVTVTVGEQKQKSLHCVTENGQIQRDFYSTSGMHYMAKQSTKASNETPDD